MAENQTEQTEVSTFLAAVEPAKRAADGARLDAIFREATGWAPKMWGPTIVGYGSYHYIYETGREGDSAATGFSPRKAKNVIYIMPGYGDYSSLLADLGKHTIGKSCLYISNLDKIDEDVLKRLIRAGLHDLGKKWPVEPT